MRRSIFCTALFTTITLPRAARATGGLDIEDQGTPEYTMRVLLTSGRAESPVRVDPWSFMWRGASYRGDFAFVPLGNGRTGLVNTLPLDAYLYGVVSSEVSEAWPLSAQQAQAIASRTYALKRRRPDRAYDVVGGESNQSYTGINGETVQGRAAVDTTSGTVITFNDQPAEIAYSACCGGHTADASEVWGSDIPYLHGVVDPYCVGSPAYAWNRSIACSEVARVVAARGQGIGTLREVRLLDITPSGRPRNLQLAGDRGTASMPSEEFRTTFGGGIVRSTLIRSANVRADELLLEGNGFGHGVGMCQWGTRLMGERGASYEEILGFYFPGTGLRRA